MQTWALALAGGVLIGLAATLLWWSVGRQAGISGIVAGLGEPDRGWRVAFLVGLVVGGLGWMAVDPSVFGAAPGRNLPMIAASGLLVGVGTRLGSGCTSGHGICGISRGSIRSLVATATFLAVGIATATTVGRLLGGAAWVG